MSYNQKLVSLMTLFLLGITAALIFTCFDLPFEINFSISIGFIFFAEFMLGAFWVQQIGKHDHVLPLSLGVCGINFLYLIYVLSMSFFVGKETKYFLLFEVVGLSMFVILHLFFRIAEHHVEDLSKDDDPEQKVVKAKITWR